MMVIENKVMVHKLKDKLFYTKEELNNLAKLLNRYYPLSPNIIDEDTWSCPECEAKFNYDDDFNYCPECGQALNFAEYLEAHDCRFGCDT